MNDKKDGMSGKHILRAVMTCLLFVATLMFLPQHIYAQKVYYDKIVALKYQEDEYGGFGSESVVVRNKKGKRVKNLYAGQWMTWDWKEYAPSERVYVETEGGRGTTTYKKFRVGKKHYQIKGVLTDYPKLIQGLYINNKDYSKRLVDENGRVENHIAFNSSFKKSEGGSGKYVPSLCQEYGTINLKLNLKKGCKILRVFYSDAGVGEAYYSRDDDRYLTKQECKGLKTGIDVPYGDRRASYFIVIEYKGIVYYYTVSVSRMSFQ